MLFFNNKLFTRIIMTITAGGIVLGNFSLPAHAGTFSHVHVDQCYRNVTKTCTDHEFGYGRESTNRSCPTCGVVRECTYETYTDVCNKGLVDRLYCAWTVKCNTCGRVLDQRDRPALRTHPYTVREIGCGLNTSQNAAETRMSVSLGEWTNGSVTVNCGVSVSDSTFSLASNPYSFNGGAFSGNSSLEVSENGTYSVTVKDSLGRTVSDSVTVSNIDKEAPIVSLSKSTDEWTESGLTISVSASDNLSGLGDAPYSFDGGAFSSSSSMHVTKNGTYSVTVCDRAGNTSSASITVSNIGRDPAIIEQERLEEERRKEEARLKEEKQKEEERRRAEERLKEEERKKEEALRREEELRQKEQTVTPVKNDGITATEDAGDDKKTGKLKDLIDRYVDRNKDEELPDEETETKEDIQDVSANDVSGNMIFVKRIDKNPPANKNISESSVDFTSNNTSDNMSLFAKIKALGTSFILLTGGIILVVLALILLSTINFVYTSKDGRFKPVSTAKISRSKKKMVVTIPSSALEEDHKYNVFYSVWTRLLRGDRRVIIDVDGHFASHVTDDGACFVYTG